jgi:hypothetical protein
VKPELRAPDCQNLVGNDGGRYNLSHTRLSVFLACHRKFELDYIKRLESIRKPRALSMGAAFQKGIELQDPEAAVRALNGYELVDCDACKAGAVTDANGKPWRCSTCGGAGKRWREPVQSLSFWDREAEDRHRVDEVVVRSAAKLYLKRWPAPPAEKREFEYIVRLRNPWTGRYSNTFNLHGYADGLTPIETRQEGGTYSGIGGQLIRPMDHTFEITENKLVGQVTAVMVKRLPLDRQLALERYATWRVTGIPVTSVRYRWIKKPSIKQKQGRENSKTGTRTGAETIDEFLERLAADYEDEERADFYAFEDEPKFVTTDDLLRIEVELWEWAEDVRAKLRSDRGRQRIFDRNTSHCSDYGGCQFLPICTGDPDAMSLFRVRPEQSAVNESAPEAEER